MNHSINKSKNIFFICGFGFYFFSAFLTLCNVIYITDKATSNLIGIFNALSLISGSVFLLAGWTNFATNLKKKCNLSVIAKIVDFKIPENSITKFPIYAFYHQGEIIKIVGQLAVSNEKKIGDETEIFINPNNPQEFLEKRSPIILLGYIVFIIILIMTILGALIWLSIILVFNIFFI